MTATCQRELPGPSLSGEGWPEAGDGCHDFRGIGERRCLRSSWAPGFGTTADPGVGPTGLGGVSRTSFEASRSCFSANVVAFVIQLNCHGLAITR